MKIRSIIIVFLMMTFGVTNCYAQTSVLSANKIYGLDPILYNGRFYTYFSTAGTKGSQFLNGPKFVKGSVQIKGKSYDNLLLNYDIHNQKIVLEYRTLMDNLMEIVLSKTWVQSFNLGNQHFEILAFSGKEPRIYQVIGKGPYKILFTWRKDYGLDHTYGATNYAFSKPVRKSYLELGKKLKFFNNNRSFVALFDSENKSALKKYLKKNRIKLNKLKKSGQEAILQLINYCNTLQSE